MPSRRSRCNPTAPWSITGAACSATISAMRKPRSRISVSRCSWRRGSWKPATTWETRFTPSVAITRRSPSSTPRSRCGPVIPEALGNRGLAPLELGRFDEAMAAYDAALRAQPDAAETRKRRAMLHLLRGDFAAGWRDYDCAVAASRAQQSANGQVPVTRWWEGQPLQGRPILVSEPNGLGDLLQYWRFIPALQAMGARVGCAGPTRFSRRSRTCGPSQRPGRVGRDWSSTDASVSTSTGRASPDAGSMPGVRSPSQPSCRWRRSPECAWSACSARPGWSS